MSTTESNSQQLAIEDFVDNVEEAIADSERRESTMSEFERLTGTTTLVEEQRPDTDRVVDESVNEDVRRATEDSHDYSDCGGDEQ